MVCWMWLILLVAVHTYSPASSNVAFGIWINLLKFFIFICGVAVRSWPSLVQVIWGVGLDGDKQGFTQGYSHQMKKWSYLFLSGSAGNKMSTLTLLQRCTPGEAPLPAGPVWSWTVPLETARWGQPRPLIELGKRHPQSSNQGRVRLVKYLSKYLYVFK